MNKNIMVCFYYGDMSKDLSILEELDNNGFEVHVFSDMSEEDITYDCLIRVLNNILVDNEFKHNIYVSSNIKEFILIVYKLYSDLCKGFLYLNSNDISFKLRDPMYASIKDQRIGGLPDTFYVIEDKAIETVEYKVFDGCFKERTKGAISNRIFEFDGYKHIFYIDLEFETKSISLDNSKADKGYKYHFDLDIINNWDTWIENLKPYLKDENKFIMNFNEYISPIYNNLVEITKELTVIEKKCIIAKLEYEINSNNTDSYKIFLGSFLLNYFPSARYVNIVLKLALISKELDKYNKFFVYNQCNRFVFINKSYTDESTLELRNKLYLQIVEAFRNTITELGPIPKNKRDENLVFVITNQIISSEHAPTKVSLETCYNLIKHLNKKVVLINTMDQLTQKGLVPMFNFSIGNLIPEYSNIQNFTYKDIEIPFYQPQVLMPNENEMMNILNMVQKFKPYAVLNISQNLTGDLCSSIVPTATIGLIMDLLAYGSTMYVLPRERADKDFESLTMLNLNRESLIGSKFTFELKPQQKSFSREEINIPVDRFIITVIGNRLNEEITHEFMGVLNEICKFNAHILFIGNFSFKEEYKEKYPCVSREHSIITYAKDLLAITELSDLYLNPKRTGGGTSAIYSLAKGKPVVSLNYGDVAANVGEEFCVESYSEMVKIVKRYIDDKRFYKSMSDIAEITSKQLVDTVKSFTNIYSSIISNKLFY